MSSIRVKRRAGKKGIRWLVYYRLGGRGYPEHYAGSFKSADAAEEHRDWVALQIAACRPIKGSAAPKKAQPELVYFARFGDLIKIGVSVDPEKRAKSLHADLLHVEEGGRNRERELHHSFKKWRVRGEWFEDNPRIQRYLAKQEASRARELEAVSPLGRAG